MKVSEIIERIKSYYKGTDENGQAIDSEKTRDKILFGNPNQDCTGIVISCWPSVHVIQEAISKNVNLIISHEALFWNHGDHTAWLEESNNSAYLEKKRLLEEHGIVVWRNHDYIHSGMPLDNGQRYTDGIFYGTMKKMEWDKYLTEDDTNPMAFTLPERSVTDIAKEWVKKLNVNGAKIIGDPDTKVSKAEITYHILGKDNYLIEKINQENIDLVIALEAVDFTVVEYIHDSNLLDEGKALLTIGHFNMEEPGMEYMLEYLPGVIDDSVPVYYVQSGDMYHYVTSEAIDDK